MSRPTPMRIVGIDMATKPRSTGLALAERRRKGWELAHAELGQSRAGLVDQVARWVEAPGVALVAIDAPLGWPEPFGRTLQPHQAGFPLGTVPDAMFQRETDRFVRRIVGKKPLEVGANLIARTAHAALALLESIRSRTGKALPLAWSPEVGETSVIEVYPAATLRQHGLRDEGYKKKPEVEARRGIVGGFDEKLNIPKGPRPRLEAEADVLDAAVCVLAAVDFLDGKAAGPSNRELAAREGWIWVAGG